MPKLCGVIPTPERGVPRLPSGPLASWKPPSPRCPDDLL